MGHQHWIFSLAALVLGLGGGIAIDRALETSEQPSTCSQEPTSVQLRSLQSSLARQSALLASLRSDLRELEGARSETDPAREEQIPAATGELEPAAEVPQPNANAELELQAATNAQLLIDDALRDGQWTEANARRLAEHISVMSEHEAQAARQRVVAALNRGELALAVHSRQAL